MSVAEPDGRGNSRPAGSGPFFNLKASPLDTPDGRFKVVVTRGETVVYRGTVVPGNARSRAAFVRHVMGGYLRRYGTRLKAPRPADLDEPLDRQLAALSAAGPAAPPADHPGGRDVAHRDVAPGAAPSAADPTPAAEPPPPDAPEAVPAAAPEVVPDSSPIAPSEDPPAPPAADALPLTDSHLADLRASGLADDTIRAAGLYSVADPAAVARVLNWDRPAGRLGPCLAFPFLAADGAPTGLVRLKPTTPRGRNGKPVKYESPRGSENRAYVPPGARAAVADPRGDLLVTEGEKKALCATQHGFSCLGLVGVEGWSRRRAKGSDGKPKGPRVLTPELAAVPWRGRRVFVVFDSDSKDKKEVRRAERALRDALARSGADARVVRLPAPAGGGKAGLDDFLVASGPAALRQLLDAAAAPPPQAPKDFGAAVFDDPAELDRLAALAVEDAAGFAAERARLKKRGAALRDLDRAIRDRVDRLRREAAAARPPRDTRDTPATPYSVRGGQIIRTVATPNGEVDVPLCNFGATITAVTVRDDGAEQVRMFTIGGRTAGGLPLPPADVPAAEFAGMNWTGRLWGNRAVVYAGQGTKDHLRAALQVLSGDAPERVVYSHLGWREAGGRWAYLHAGGAVGAEGVEVEPGSPLAGYVLPDPPAGKALTDAVKASLRPLTTRPALAPDRVVVPVLGAAYRAALGGTLDFAVHLTGPTGAFKSELAALAQQHYGAGLDARNFPANWSGTPNAIEMTAPAAKDALTVVDDFAPNAVPDPAKLYAAADRVFRGAGNKAGRGRLNADLSARPDRPPRGLILSTGEDLPRGHSVRARVLVGEVEPGDVDPGVLTGCQADAAAGRYAAALAGFVSELAPRYGSVLRGLPGERTAARDGFAAGAAHARVPGAVADLWLGWVYFLNFALGAGAVTADERGRLLARVRAALVELAAAQEEHQRAADPVDQFLRLVPAVLSSGAAHLEEKDGGRPGVAPELLGWQRDPGGD